MRAIITLERFSELLDEIIEELPEEFFNELNGGVILSEQRKIHPESVGDQLRIMGEYHRERALGRYVVIYYGSFMDVYGHLSEERMKDRLRKTVRHEFRHHLESLAGEKDLEVEDAISIAKYKNSVYREGD